VITAHAAAFAQRGTTSMGAGDTAGKRSGRCVFEIEIRVAASDTIDECEPLR
jgi:hypothetical protein